MFPIHYVSRCLAINIAMYFSSNSHRQTAAWSPCTVCNAVPILRSKALAVTHFYFFRTEEELRLCSSALLKSDLEFLDEAQGPRPTALDFMISNQSPNDEDKTVAWKMIRKQMCEKSFFNCFRTFSYLFLEKMSNGSISFWPENNK
jgi:hypothetical protein